MDKFSKLWGGYWRRWDVIICSVGGTVLSPNWAVQGGLFVVYV